MSPEILDLCSNSNANNIYGGDDHDAVNLATEAVSYKFSIVFVGLVRETLQLILPDGKDKPGDRCGMKHPLQVSSERRQTPKLGLLHPERLASQFRHNPVTCLLAFT